MTEEKVCDAYCEDCYYRRVLCEQLCCCVYLFVEDEMRGCPPGEGCTKKIIKRKGERNG